MSKSRIIYVLLGSLAVGGSLHASKNNLPREEVDHKTKGGSVYTAFDNEFKNNTDNTSIKYTHWQDKAYFKYLERSHEHSGYPLSKYDYAKRMGWIQ